MRQIGLLFTIFTGALSVLAQASDIQAQHSKITPEQRISEVLSHIKSSSRQERFQVPQVQAPQTQLFLQAPQYPVGSGPVWVVTADFNRDGKIDIATVNLGVNPSSVSVLLGNGDGTFQSAVNYTVGYLAASLAVGDFNGDGNPDLVAANFCTSSDCTASSMSVLLGKGDGTFKNHVDYPAGMGSLSVAVADLNHDGKDDFVTADLLDTVTVTLGNGDGTFQPPVSYAEPQYSDPWAIVISDFNGDHKLDLATANYRSFNVSVFLGNGDGTFQSPQQYGHTGNPTTITAADLDDDGNMDIVTDNVNGNLADSVVILLGKGDGTFPQELSYPSGVLDYGIGWSHVAVADVNGDGKWDLAMANTLGGAISVFPGVGDGTFPFHEAWGTGDNPRAIAVGDFNGDGIKDLVSANADDNTVSILLGRGDATFIAREDSDTFVGPNSIATGDFNGDGREDVVTANSIYGTVSVLLGNGDGGFQPHVDYDTGGDSWAVVAADLNGDQKLDLAVTNVDKNTVAVLLGNGDGTFRHPITYAAACAQPVAVADLNHDGKLDVVVGSACDETVEVFLGNGDGTLRALANFSVGAGVITSIAIADMNGDGNQDLVVTTVCAPGTEPGDCVTTGTLSILLGKGDGTFPTYTAIPLINQSFAAVVDDFNGDHKPDIAVGQYTVDQENVNGFVRVFLGNGDGTLQDPVDYPTGNDFTLSLASADLNGDGKPDLAVGGSDLLLGNGDGSFQSFSSFQVPAGPISISDFNGDGKPDLAIANSGAYTVSIYLNLADFPEFPLSVTRSGTGTGTIASAPPGISCGNTCSSNFIRGVSVTLTSTPAPGSVFAGWSGDCSGAGDCSVTMNAAKNVTATFNLMPDFTISASALSPASVNPGQSATATIDVTALDGFTSSVSLTCAVSPSPQLAPQCSISPNSVTPGTRATLTVTTTAPQMALACPSRQPGQLYALWLPFTSLALLSVGLHCSDKKRLLVGVFCLSLCAGLMLLPSCGGDSSPHGSSGTPPGTYTIAVTGQSGSLQHTASAALTVQ